MADNISLPATSGTIATDDIGGIEFQRVKLIHGIDGTNDGDVALTNPLPTIEKGGLVSTNNSSTTPLAGDAVFTGTGEDVSDYSSIAVSWDSDVASAASGMSMQFSTDNTNWDRMIPVSSGSNSLQTNHGGVHRLTVIAKYFRIVYTNGTAAQSHFRVQSLFHTTNSLPLVSRLGQQLSISTDCQMVRPAAKIELDIARKHITGQSAEFLIGFNGAVGTSWVDIHPNSGDINWLTTAGTIEVVSTNVNDTAAGTGVRSVEVHGLSATGVDQDEVIALNGTTPVTSSLTYIRVNKVHNEDVGTYGGSHQGDITVQVSGAGAVLSVMKGLEGAVNSGVQYGVGEADNGYWSVPLGKVMYITGLECNINTTGTKTADIILYERDGLLTTSAPFQPRRILWSAIEVQGLVVKDFHSFIKIKPLADIWFRSEASNSGTKIAVTLDFFLMDQNSAGA